MNDDKIIIEHLRNQLSPKGTADIVRIGFIDSSASNVAFYNSAFITKVIDAMEKRLITVEMGEPLTPLERLGVDVLLSSAHIGTPERIRDLLSRYRELDDDASPTS